MCDVTSLTTHQQNKFRHLVEATQKVIIELPNATKSDQQMYLSTALDCFIGIGTELSCSEPVMILLAQLKQLESIIKNEVNVSQTLSIGWFYMLREDYKLGVYLLERVQKAKSKRFQPNKKRFQSASIFLSKVYSGVNKYIGIIRDEKKSSAYANIASAILSRISQGS